MRLGELLLRTSPPSGERAQAWFERALALHEAGCALGERDLWAALEGLAISRIVQGHYAEAEAPLRRSLSRWPGVRATRYNLACVLCRTGDVNGCARELERLLTTAPEEAPEFLAEQRRPISHYRSKLRTDPDLASLRQDRPRWRALLDATGG